MPPIKCTPCRVTYQGQRYHILANGDVHLCFIEYKRQPDFEESVIANKSWTDGSKVEEPLAKLIRKEASRQRRNRNTRERNAAMRSLGMTKTPFGWE